ncbi:hypothetical protein P8C59_004106 [Phyllachora maydis]|uniref:Initiator tRNA phosphoribosyl transferase n=1 Tax=Phyllachora maydis TaxID=1825666 RepID=A0AAD9I1X4_9PEZI|nr:hypothetical protein P8C59_004106 [Phyllachora maydis]
MASPPAPSRVPGPTVADLIFSSEQANHNFSRVLGDLKRANLGISNRLRSIRQDAAFVGRIAAETSLPLVANERCGSWYIPPEHKGASAYFKSTDGHTGQRMGRCIIVDSTRRGKSMPDALSKTVPTWCCVLNRALFPSSPSSHALHVPQDVVSVSEKSQMEARMPAFLASFQHLEPDLSTIRLHLHKPLQPLWRTQDDDDKLGAGAFAARLAAVRRAGLHPVVCCTSSRRVRGAELSEAGYVQGAADDTENWALGLTAPVFWRHAGALLAAPEPDLPPLIGRLLREDGQWRAAAARETRTRVLPHVSVGSLPLCAAAAPGEPGEAWFVVAIVPRTTPESEWRKDKNRLEVGLGAGKGPRRMLRSALRHVSAAVEAFLRSEGGGPAGLAEKQVLVSCETGKDLAVGVALALYCWCFDEGGHGLVTSAGERPSFTKTMIKARLGRIMTAMPDANPSRSTLQSVNSFLMDWVR